VIASVAVVSQYAIAAGFGKQWCDWFCRKSEDGTGAYQISVKQAIL